MNHTHERIAYGAQTISAFATVLWIAAPNLDAVERNAGSRTTPVVASAPSTACPAPGIVLSSVDTSAACTDAPAAEKGARMPNPAGQNL